MIDEEKINILELVDGAKIATGTVIIIDVFRAFSLEPYLYNMGATLIRPVESVEDAFQLKKMIPNAVLIGERKGVKCEGFDYGNSPSSIKASDINGRVIIHTTSQGTKGLANVNNPQRLLTGSFVNAKAISKYILALNPSQVSLVCMGNSQKKVAEEDLLCALYIKSMLTGHPMPNLSNQLTSLRYSAGKKFFLPSCQVNYPEQDFWLCIKNNIFNFVISVEKDDLGLCAKRLDI